MRSRIGFSLAPACNTVEAPACDGSAASAQNAGVAAASFMVEGEVLEVLGGYGLAHVRAADGSFYGLNRQTSGIQFEDLREGQHVRLEVTRKFNRVLRAQLLG